MGRLSNKDAKETAKRMFLSGQHQQKEIAKIIGRSENTISRWVRDEKWELLRANLTTTKENVLGQLYAQLAEINKNVESRDEGSRFATAKEADAIVKLSAAIARMETETGISEISSVSIGFLEFVRGYDLEKAKEFSDHFDAYITSKMK